MIPLAIWIITNIDTVTDWYGRAVVALVVVLWAWVLYEIHNAPTMEWHE